MTEHKIYCNNEQRKVIMDKIIELELAVPVGQSAKYRTRDILALCGAPEDVPNKHLIFCGRVLRSRGWEHKKFTDGQRYLYWEFYNGKKPFWS